MLSLNNLPKTSGKKKTRVGRGNSSAGNYSGRGMKGQRARSGGKGGLKLRGLKQSMMAQPKNRGFSSPHAKAQAVNLAALEKAFDAGAEVTPASLKEKGLVTSTEKPVKILGVGTLSKKLTINVNAASETAVKAIEAAGGTFTATQRRLPEKLKNKKKKK